MQPLLVIKGANNFGGDSTYPAVGCCTGCAHLGAKVIWEESVKETQLQGVSSIETPLRFLAEDCCV